MHALAGHLHSEGIKQAELVGVLLPNCAAISLIYFANQNRRLQDVLRDADLKLLVSISS